jgi:phenylacetate-CoA ligase
MEYLKLHGEHFPVRGIMLGSEGVSYEERCEIEKFFKAKTVAWYGQSEKVILADDDLAQGAFSVFSSYGYPCLFEAHNGFGEIAGTSFVNRALPLIKYMTGDFGRLTEEGGVFKLSGIHGRWGKDFVLLNRDKSIPTTSINLHSDIQKEILYYQIHQNEFGKIKIKILPKPSTKLSLDALLLRFQAEMKKSLHGFEIKCVIVQSENEIVKSPRGKAMMLIQEIDTLRPLL